jgi:predicted DNA-binding transcriptional regulator AlpA
MSDNELRTNRPESPLADQAAEHAPTLLLSKLDLAHALRVSTKTVERLDCALKLPRAVRMGGRGHKRWSRDAIREWIEQGCPDRDQFEQGRKSR